jgi:DNA-directed RNA polymerase subunit alpha
MIETAEEQKMADRIMRRLQGQHGSRLAEFVRVFNQRTALIGLDKAVAIDSLVELMTLVGAEKIRVILDALEESGPQIRKSGESDSLAKEAVIIRLFNKPISELEITVRLANCLERARIDFLGELVQKTGNDLLQIKNFGHRTLREVKELLLGMGLQLGTKVGDWKPPTT